GRCRGRCARPGSFGKFRGRQPHTKNAPFLPPVSVTQSARAASQALGPLVSWSDHTMPESFWPVKVAAETAVDRDDAPHGAAPVGGATRLDIGPMVLPPGLYT